MADSLNADFIWRGGGGVGEHDFAGKGGGVVTGSFSIEDSRRGSVGSYFKGDGGGQIQCQ